LHGTLIIDTRASADLLTQANEQRRSPLQVTDFPSLTGFEPVGRSSSLSWRASGKIKRRRATLAQLVERLIRNQQVAGSSPAGGSIFSSIYGSRPIVSLFKT
jgi:hypothetical protein